MKELNKIQKVALELIHEDARFLITLVGIFQNAKNIDSNYISMSLPYIGIFADGAEQWGKKVGIQSKKFSKEEKEYYSIIRSGHKLYDKSYNDLKNILKEKLKESDDYFYNIRSESEKSIGYFNFGVDKMDEEYCGNTILCAAYMPFSPFDSATGLKMKRLSEVAGELAKFYCNNTIVPYQYSKSVLVTYEDFHFNQKSPIRMKSFDGFILFSILCNINYAIVFIENFFTEEIVPKFKFAYLQYYYLCKFIKEFNKNTKYKLILNDSLYHSQFRNCLAHYGLGQFLKEIDLKEDDLLKGLTIKAFNLNYIDTKKQLYQYLKSLVKQIEMIIF